jgi:superfamily II DNA/RNA helicase
MVGIAQTGSGKTLAVSVAVVDRRFQTIEPVVMDITVLHPSAKTGIV